MRIELDKLDDKRGAFSHRYQPGELVLDEEHARLTEAPEVQGRATRSSREVRVQGRVSARAEVDCGRCLKSVDVPVEVEFDVRYVPASDYEQVETAELQEEDLSFSVFEEEAIDLDELVREQVLLALPTRALCSEECKGLCPACGADRNRQPCDCETKETDPRWGALKDLVNGK